MSRVLVVLVSMLSCGMLSAQAEEAGVAAPAPEVAPSERMVGLVAVGPVDPALVERVRNHVQEQTALPVRLHEGLAPAGKYFGDELETVAAAKTETDLYIVGLVWPELASEKHAVYDYGRGVAVVNVRALKPAEEDLERFGRRLEKVVVRSYGLLFGLQPVAMPASALYPYKDLGELDRIARTFDPPSLVQVQSLAKQKGITLYKDSHFILVP